jgi:H/ACA ribonucleoprotein complex subunit 2
MTEDMDVSAAGDDELSRLSYEERAKRATVISKPMASKKLAKKLMKLIKKAHKQKDCLRSGLKLVQSKIKKNERGLVVIAGSVTPIDVVCHMPAVCEQNDIPYVFVPTGRELGLAMGVKRCTLIVLIKRNEDYGKLYDECFEEVKHLPPVVPVET